MTNHAVSLLGFLIFAGVAWLLSNNRWRVAWKTIAWGVALQLLIGLIIFRLPVSHRILLWLNDAVLALLNASKSGSVFLFGPLAASPGEAGSVGFILVFQVLPVVIFFAAFTAMLYHLRVLQVFVRLFAKLFHRTMKISGAESLSSAANIFVGIESALVIRPYLARMTRSELLLILTTGMATVASSVLGVYVAFLSGVFPEIAGHLISASILAIPACVVVSKLLIPEMETPETLAAVPAEDESTRSKTLIGAIIEGAMDGLKLAAGISALIIAILGIVALLDKLLGVVSSWFGMSEPLSIVRLLGWAFYPFAFLLGIQTSDVPIAARLLGERVILTEVFSYNHLAQLISTGEVSDPRTVVILSYALCGFAHVAAMAIFVGGTAALAPTRRDDLASLGLRALLAATLATLMTGCVAGMFSSREGVLLNKSSNSPTSSQQAQPTSEANVELRRQIEQIASVAKGRVGVAAEVLETGESVALAPRERFPMQSVYKLPIAMAVLAQVDSGKLNLEQRVRVEKSDYVRSGQHSPIRDRNPRGGVELSIRELLRFAVSESDGTASDVLLALVGVEAAGKYLNELGVNELVVANSEKEIGANWETQYRNWSSPHGSLQLLRSLHERRGVSEQSRELLYKFMTDSPTGPKRLKGLLPKTAVVAHKTGTSGTSNGITAATNDIGLITLPNGRHLAIAVFVSDSPTDLATREKVIAEIAKAVWDKWSN